MPDVPRPVPARTRTDGRTRTISWWWLPALVAVAFQLWGVYRVQPPPVEPGFPDLDKVAHFLAFGLPVVFGCLAVDRTRRRRGSPRVRPRRLVGAAVIISLVHAVASEIIQGAFYTYRSGDPFDVLADAIGVGGGALLGWRAVRR